jgi:hypothetical protein
MNRKLAIWVTLLVAAGVVTGLWALLRMGSEPAVTVTLRVAVAPAGQVSFVEGRAKSAQFKYLMGKQSGVKPVLAQKLTLTAVPNSALLEARIGVPTKDEAKRYVEVFVPTLQDLCGRQVQLTLAGQTVR